MKCLLLSFLSLVTLLHVQAQDSAPVQVPDAVTRAFKQAYPQAAAIKWKQKKETYKADFKIGKADHELWLTPAGAVEKHSFEIKAETLPEAVKSTLQRDFASYTPGKCEQTDEKGATTYKVELKSTAGKKNVKFGADGKVIVKKDDTK